MNKIIFFSPFLLTLLLTLSACSNNKNKNQKQIETENPNRNNTTQILESPTKPKKNQIFQKGRFNLDSTSSKAEWFGEKTTGSHNGDIQIEKGFIETDDNGNIISGKFMLDMQSINCTDLRGKRKSSIEEHLKNEDFFDTKKYPHALFVIEQVKEKTIIGSLTLKGITKKIKFNYTQLNNLTYTAEIIVDRTLFDIKYKSKTIFPDIGDQFIYDEFKITLNPIKFRKDG